MVFNNWQGVIDHWGPRSKNRSHKYSLFDKFKRRIPRFEQIVIEAILKGHSSRKASNFFAAISGWHTISRQAAQYQLRMNSKRQKVTCSDPRSEWGVKPFKRFPNTQSCKRWLYALITEIKPANTVKVTIKKQQSS